MLDDLQWADPASVELLGALLHRPPTGAVVMALALRPSRKPGRLLAALERAHRSGTLVRIELGALTPMEARELLGATVRPAEADVLYEESGGNAFYLEQLARSLDRAGGRTPSAGLLPSDIGVPAAVAASAERGARHAVRERTRRVRRSRGSRRPVRGRACRGRGRDVRGCDDGCPRRAPTARPRSRHRGPAALPLPSPAHPTRGV